MSCYPLCPKPTHLILQIIGIDPEVAVRIVIIIIIKKILIIKIIHSPTYLYLEIIGFMRLAFRSF